MKRNGKYEGKPADANKKQVKSLLLQTYFTSLLSLVLCVSMFFGTSYAWFTSEVTSSNNEIYVGTLKVGLTKGDNVDLIGTDEKLFDSSIRWEPGYTALETVRVVNGGDLAFKYVMNFTDGERLHGEKSLESVASCFDVWVYDYTANKLAAKPAPKKYEDISEKKGWEYLGTLDELLAGKIVLSGELEADENKKDDVFMLDTYTIALHMNEGADADVMGHKISLSVKLVAYQTVNEADGLGNSQYDNVTAVSTAEDLKEALNHDKNVVLTTNVVIKDSSGCLVMQDNIFDGSDNTITYTGQRVNDSSVGVLKTYGGNLSNLTIEGGENGRALYCTKLASDLLVKNCNFSGAYAFNLNSAEVTEHIIRFEDTYFGSWVSYANVMEHAYFKDCTFGNTLKPYGSTTLTDCNFNTFGLDLSALQSGETITLINCTYNGIKIEKATMTSAKIDGVEGLEIDANGIVNPQNA